MADVHEVADHELIEVYAGTTWLRHHKAGDAFQVSTSGPVLSEAVLYVRAVAFATGVHETV